MDELVIKGRLLDQYGMLLTEKQRYCMEQYYEWDMSLGEIAENLGVSRQAVHDNLHRAVALLDEYEAKLQLVAEAIKRQQIIADIQNYLAQDDFSKEEVLRLLTLLDDENGVTSWHLKA